MCRNHKLGAFSSCKREFYAVSCSSLSLLVAHAGEHLPDHAVPSSAPSCPGGSWEGEHGNTPPLTLRGESCGPSSPLRPRKGQHHPEETSHGKFGIIYLPHSICVAYRSIGGTGGSNYFVQEQSNV